MNPTFIGAGLDALTERWWVPVMRGIAAIIFGVLALASPAIGLLALVIMWGVYAITDGVFNLVLATRAGKAGERCSILFGVLLVGLGVRLHRLRREGRSAFPTGGAVTPA